MKSISFLNSQVLLADPSKSRELITVSDTFTRKLTAFDLQSRLQKGEDVTENDYLKLAASSVREWDEEERELLEKYILQTADKIKSLNLTFDLPDELFLIKSIAEEEAGAAGYTRRNFIVLNGERISQALFEHELWHIISRNNPELARKAYGLLGFSPCNQIELPAPFCHSHITNPDAPDINYFIRIHFNGKQVAGVLTIFADKPYAGGRLFDYFRKGLLLVKGEEVKRPVLENGQPKVISFEEAEGFFEQIGRNTSYNIHQEEITADHFVFGINRREDLPDPHLVTGLTELMKGAK